MKLKSLAFAAALIAGSVGLANANPVELIHNGDFSQTTDNTTTPTQFGNQSAYGYTATQFITGWVGNDGYEMWYPNATDATTVDAHSAWGQGSNHDTGAEMLWAVATPPNTTAFVGMDGDQAADGNGNNVQGSIGQWLDNLTAGERYTVSFDWGAGQLKSRDGETHTQLQIYAGNNSDAFADLLYTTSALDNPSHGFTGWDSDSFSFTAGASSLFLNFLSVGTPSGLPPVALLANVSMTRAVPEPPELALFGLGLLGLGLLTVGARRRALRRQAGDSDIG